MEKFTKFLVHKQLSVIDKHFGKDNHSLRFAFEDFGQVHYMTTGPKEQSMQDSHDGRKCLWIQGMAYICV